MMGKYQSYPNYKKASVTWLDEMPEHWILSKVKYIAPFQVGWTPPTKNDENFVGENLWVNISDLKEKVITNTSKRISDRAAKEASMSITPKGSLMYSFKLSVGSVSFAGEDMYTNEAIASFLDSARLPLSYLYYALPKFVIENASTNIYGARILNQELINNAQLLEPTYEEAENIANFLDHETAIIDTLIEKQQQLIKLLKEKRQAVISHAVTKGIPNKEHSNVPMKDSGVEWLGEVPEHWVVTKLKYLSSIQGGYAFSSDSFTEEGVQILRIGNVYQNRLALERQPIFVPHKMLNELSDFKVQQNDILMSLTGTLGKRDYGFAIKVEHCDSFLLNQRVAKLLPFDAKVDLDFLINVLWSESYLTQLYSLPSGTKQANLANSDVLGIVVAIPPTKEEQRAIANYLSQKLEYFDRTIEKAQNATLLMQERRTALISAAVTGKIDVRNWEQPND
ncbi:restriction endonuclease subunit S [Pseudoalteromonas sp. Angola-4]|uniref:restriction endonuclease subunit S n=1 Tax=Pseudoalteromonas sp. Angola-4 TaxID=3025335 RepID=UPI002358B486|nr:restriction endonuclease subunit S [Pseudoalteromonas sp. Angola-4]MDC9509386.1 restriction endonuclease subunit S [Pseudoalteromonas sp. Angola-4]